MQPAQALNAVSTSRADLIIEKPASGTKVNSAGGKGFLADADRSTPACDADFWVACRELGKPVQLHYDSASGKVFASGTCNPRAAGDPPLPGSAYKGRAKIRAAFENGRASVAVVATQNPIRIRTESSDAIALRGDCRAPAPAFSGDPCGSANGNRLMLSGTTFHEDVSVIDTAPADSVTPALVVANTDGTSGTTTLATSRSGSYRFAAVNLGGAGTVTLTAKLTDDFGNQGSTSCSATIAGTDTPVLSVSAPADGSSFAPGSGTCDAGAGNFGVQIAAMADGAANRSASVSVNGGPAQPLAIGSGGAITGCVALPDDAYNAGMASTLVVHLESTSSHAFVEDALHVSVHTLASSISTDANHVINTGSCSSGPDFGAPDISLFDPSLAGKTYTIAVDGSPVAALTNKSVVPPELIDCVPLAEGPHTVSVTIDSTPVSSTFNVIAISHPLANAIALDAPSLPDANSATYRRDPVTVSWPKPAADYAGQLVAYEMRCHTRVLAAAASLGTKDAWWAEAQVVTLPSGLDPNAAGATHSAALHFRIGETRNCVLRAKDGAGQLTPSAGSKDLTLPFRETQIVPPGLVVDTDVGKSVAPVGDVNGDGIDDVLVGGWSQVALVFGRSGPPTGTPDVEFNGFYYLGWSVTGLGDFNGDGLNDFAMGEPQWNDVAGRVYVFFGRSASRPWPAAVDLTAATPGVCNADLCLDYPIANGFFGKAVSSAGNFNAAGGYDLAIGAIGDPPGVGKAYIVLGTAYEHQACTTDGDCRATESCGAGVCSLKPTTAFWGIDVDVTTGTASNPEPGAPATLLQGFKLDGDPATMFAFGAEFAALGAQDAMPGDDLAVSAFGNASPVTKGKVYFLSGRAYSGSGMQSIPTSALGINADGQPFATASDLPGGNAEFGFVVSALGNVYNVAGGAHAGAGEIGVERALDNGFEIYPGDNDMSTSDSIEVTASPHVNLGTSIANGVFPGLPSISADLDGDGRPELCVGAAFYDTATTGDVWIWYADSFAAGINARQVRDATGSRTVIPGTGDANGGSSERIVDFAGDINNDGYPDIVVGDPTAGFNGERLGRAFLLF